MAEFFPVRWPSASHLSTSTIEQVHFSHPDTSGAEFQMRAGQVKVYHVCGPSGMECYKGAYKVGVP